MQLNTSISTRLEQRQIIAPRMIQSMEILQLPVMALQERIEHELQENPVLEQRDSDRDEESFGAEETAGPAAPETPPTDVNDPQQELIIDAKESDQDFDRLD